MIVLKQTLLSALLCVCCLFSAGQVIDATICDSTTRFPITQFSSYLRSTTSLSLDSVIKSSPNFIKASNKPVLVFNYDPYYYWFRIIVKNVQDKPRTLMLLMAPVGIYEGRLFQNTDGKWKDVAHTGLKYPFRERTYQFTHHVFPFTLAKNSTDTLYLSIDATAAYKVFGFALIKPKELKIFENKIYFVFGIIEGLLILFLVLNIALFVALKERLHLWYALYIALLFLIVMKNDHLDQQFLGLDSELAFRLTPYLTIGALAIAVLMHVAQNFLKATLIQNKLLYRFSLAFKANVLCSAVIHAFVFNVVSDYHIQLFVFNWAKISTSLGICVIIVECMYCIKKGVRSALFIFSGSLVFMIGSVQRLYFPSTLSFLFPPTTFHIGIILETFVISMALIYRYWSEKDLQRKKEEKIQTQTLNDISEEIHDNIGQTLALANLNLRTINFNSADSIQNKTSDTKILISKAITDLRDLSRTMKNDSFVGVNIIKEVRAECAEVGKPGAFRIAFSSNVESLTIATKKQVIVMRIIKGVFQNVIRHSQASLVEVDLDVKPGILSIKIKDNGIGFDLSGEALNSNGHTNIRNRCLLLKAACNIESEPGSGTKITIDMPV